MDCRISHNAVSAIPDSWGIRVISNGFKEEIQRKLGPNRQKISILQYILPQNNEYCGSSSWGLTLFRELFTNICIF